MLKKLLVLTILGSFCACSFAPTYETPKEELPEGKEVNLSLFDKESWWEVFGDETLNKLETEALANNKDLVAAMAKVDAARAQVGIATADQMPQIGVNAGADRGNKNDNKTQNVYQGTANFSFTLDLWGKYRNLSEAARAELLSTESEKDSVRLTLTSDVARYYFAVLTLEDELNIAKETLTSREKSLNIYQVRYKEGLSSEFDLKRVEAEKASVEASVADFQRELSKAQTALSVLLGRSPKEIVESKVETQKALKEITLNAELPEGIPADLLTRRPDVRVAEGHLIAANANIGVARAAYFPDISLTGAFGTASSSFNKLFTGDTKVWDMAANLIGPIFTGGRITSQVKQAEAQYKMLLANYDKVVQNAYKETYDALIDNQQYREVVKANQAQRDALARSLELSNQQKNAGLIGVLDVLDVERNLLSAELALSTAQRNQLNAVVSVAQSLGGGWKGGAFPTSDNETKTKTTPNTTTTPSATTTSTLATETNTTTTK